MTQNKSAFNFQEGIEQNNNVLSVSDVASTFNNAQEVADFYRTSLSGGWKVEIVL